MYTLEDDEETSSRLKQRDFLDSLPTDETQVGTFAEPTANGATNEAEGEQQAFPELETLLPPPLPPEPDASKMTKAGPAEGERRLAIASLTIACIAVFFTSLDQTVVVTALPQIITDLQIPLMQLDHASWIVSAYLLGFVIAMPLMGRVSDIYGRRRIFLLCLAPILGQAVDISFLSVFNIDISSPGLVWLIAARLIQAIGGGAVVPIAMALAGDFYGKERRGLALGIIGAMTEAGGALGPLYGAIIVEHLGWQAIFYLNLPIVLLILIGASFPKANGDARGLTGWEQACLRRRSPASAWDWLNRARH